MTTPVKIGAFLVALAVVFGIALVVGKVVTSDDEPDAAGHDDMGTSTKPPGGLTASQDGYTFRLADASAEPGDRRPVEFTIEGPDGKPVTRYDVEHEKRLHLIAVRRDFTGFQHVHPELDGQGTWSTEVDLTPGTWRLFADFKATGAEALTLGSDLSVSGDYQPESKGGEVRTAKVDGYTVELAGDLRPGSDSKLTLSVSRDGKPVTDLQPYLGAYGHLVALREGDLAYLHVHPEGEPGETKPGPDVVFYAAVPSRATYRLYLDFRHDGVVRTAEFTVPATAPADSEEMKDDGHGDDH
jgi:hypothetical protein